MTFFNLDALDIDNLNILGLESLESQKLETLKVELVLLRDLKRLDTEKKLKTKLNRLNKENGKYRKGFSSNFHNFERDNNTYSKAEDLFKDLLLEHNLSEFIHEHKVKVKDINDRTHTYHLDFYFYNLKVCIEVNPIFHETYRVVKIRDNLREYLLKRKMHIKTFKLRVLHKCKKGKLLTRIDKRQSKRIIKKLKSLKVSKETLTFYLRG